MAKYLAKIIVMGVQVMGRAFARALRQEFAASQAAADTRGCAGHQSAATSNLSGLSLQEAQQILNISRLNPELGQKNYEHPFKVNDKIFKMISYSSEELTQLSPTGQHNCYTCSVLIAHATDPIRDVFIPIGPQA
ncbi:Mitochondrial import inner membrane translocase subunit tim16-A [Microtus ochrogaster]|uniref:Mitochondrial import inner membrane translocase subunit tim16-A n=1 Tax=Microtus ochrogaster TaxID=79684 RepID=A0A8J6GDF3_MICOH|nr:Mitochondrial import inner membrane translocase subunit tim16-A [Microtus ochrogaster]